MDIKDIYEGAERLINDLIRREMSAQGHFLTGTMEDSLSSIVIKEKGLDVMEGFAVSYTQYVDQGVPASKTSMKQFPFVYQYFLARGLPDKEAKAAAAATIHKWAKEGMSTQASKRFSKLEHGRILLKVPLLGSQDKVDEYMNNSFDFAIEEEFQKEKSEVI
jgi:hypothetical protein